MNKIIIIIVFALSIVACTTTVKYQTLRDIDITGHYSGSVTGHATPKNEKEIRQAYAEYLKHASKNDISRIDALQRLAQLEFSLTQKLENNKGVQTIGTQKIEDKIYNSTLDRSIDLLETSLRDYPNSKHNDRTLYQLSKAYDQRGLYEKSITTLRQLVSKFPKSDYYVESKFRLAEYAFSRKQYAKAEDIYTDIIVSRNNNNYLENALYKRGWARFKQGFYQEAIEDFLKVINRHGFSESNKLNASQKSQFNEYFRAIGLSFSYLGGAEPLNEYFHKHPDFKFIYYTYERVSSIYLKQQRYSDAVNTLKSYIDYHPNSVHVPSASIKILGIWKDGGFSNKLIPALARFYDIYQPQSKYWSSHKVSQHEYNTVTTAIRNYTVLAATYYHKQYIGTHEEESFKNAKIWYERYLKHYKAYSHKDTIHLLYAELLSKHDNLAEALYQFEQAAYDSSIILNKNAAYSTILLADKLHSSVKDSTHKSTYLDKLISYSLLYAHLYPNDSQTTTIITRAAEEAYRAGKYTQAVTLTELYGKNNYTKASYNINIIKANSYFKLHQYKDAESSYHSILQHYRLDSKSKSDISNNLAISIYDQGKAAVSANQFDLALQNYSRISDIVPASSVATSGLYKAISLCMQKKMWINAIRFIKKFQSIYPSDKLSQDVSKKLSVAYLNSHQDIAAANELIKISRTEHDAKYKSVALWKAGELYESKNDYSSAIRSFEEYADNYHRPYAQYAESIEKIITLYTQLHKSRNANHWRRKVLHADIRIPADQKTDRTKLIASKAALVLANKLNTTYTGIKLTIPLAKSLSRKKHYMQKAVNLYGRASTYGISAITTEATYSIGKIYQAFSKALLTSDRPKNLSKNELEQYNILLEDKSFPFDDKAIEFFSTNLSHVKEGVYNDWLQKSYAQLKLLYPARYNRDVKLEGYVNVLQ